MAVPPLSPYIFITDGQGRPTPEFMQLWQQQAFQNAGIVPLSTPAEISAVLDILGSTHGDLLFRGASSWETLAPATAGFALTSGGPDADPVWVTLDKAFTDLTDTPSAYIGAAGQAVVVNPGEDGLEFDGALLRAIPVAQGGTDVLGAIRLNFVGATVTEDPVGTATVAITGSGGSGGALDRAQFSPITDATSWVSVGVADPRATGSVTMRESNNFGYVGWEDTGGTVGQTRMLEAVSGNPAAGADFDKVFRLDIYLALDFPPFMGVFVRNTSNDRRVAFGLFNTNNRWYRQYWNGPTFVSEADISRRHSGLNDRAGYIRVRRTGDDLVFSTSVNGITWVPHNTISIAAHILNIDRIGVYGNPSSTTYSAILLWGLDNGPQNPPTRDAPSETFFLSLEGSFSGTLSLEGDFSGSLTLEGV